MTESLRTPPRVGLALPATLLAAQAGGLAALHLRDPHVAGSWGACPILALTGHPCPFCGGLRATADLTHGRWGQAWSENAAGVLAVALSLVLTVTWLVAAVRARRCGDRDPAEVLDTRVTAAAVVVALVAWIGFGALRLLPQYAWLQP